MWVDDLVKAARRLASQSRDGESGSGDEGDGSGMRGRAEVE